MPAKKSVVFVNASFEKEKELFQTIKKYATDSDDKYAYWEDFAFTVDPAEEYDAILVFNNPSGKISARCFKEWVIAFMMEPGIKGRHPWMFTGLDQYARVFSPIDRSANTIPSHGYLGWYFKHNWNYLNELALPLKKHRMSCIASNIALLPGQQLRVQFVNMLRERMPGIHFFGRGIQFLADKLEGLLPYNFSIVIENTSMDNYFTEKINDCFLGYSIPVYHGCKNIGKFFPEKSYITIDIEQPAKAIRTIEEVMLNDDWNERVDALKEARHLVLNKYQPLAGAAAIFRNTPVSSEKIKVIVKPVQPNMEQLTRDLLLKIKERLRK